VCKSITDKIINNITLILVSPLVPENIGLVSRVLKNTGFSNLYLVSPALTPKSFEVAKRARDILEKAKVFNTLKEAIASSHFVLGTTRRKREYKFIYNFKDILPYILSLAKKKEVSILFGKENFGLSKEEVDLCDSLFYLPANPEFPSYNLAFAVGIVCYQIFVHLNGITQLSYLDLAKKKEIDNLFLFINEGLRKLGWKENELKSTIFSLRRIFLRTYLTKSEVRLLKKIFLSLKSL